MDKIEEIVIGWDIRNIDSPCICVAKNNGEKLKIIEAKSGTTDKITIKLPLSDSNSTLIALREVFSMISKKYKRFLSENYSNSDSNETIYSDITNMFKSVLNKYANN